MRHLAVASSIALFCVVGSPALAAGWRPPVLRLLSPPKDVTLESKSIEIEDPDLDEEEPAIAKIKGHHAGKNTNLIWTIRYVRPTPEGDFELRVPIEGKVTPIVLTAIDDYGATEKISFELLFEDWDIYLKEVLAKQNPLTTGKVFVGVGPTMISYTETGVEDYSSIVLTGKAGYSRMLFSPKWSVGISGYLTLLPIQESYAASARFLGLNFRLGYNFLSVPLPWRVSLHVGSYYATMIVAHNAFGFENVNGPQIYPVVQRLFNKGKSVRGYFKLSPLSTNSAGLSFASRELAFGAEYVFFSKRGKTRSVSLDYSDFLVNLPGLTDGTQTIPDQRLSAKTISIAVSYGF